MSGFARQLERLRESEGSPSDPETFAEQIRSLRTTRVQSTKLPPTGGDRMTSLPRGTVVATDHGRHYRITNDYPDPYFHGTVRLGRFSEPDFRILLELAGLDSVHVGRADIVFLDTETTGVHVGAGMCPFLIGIGFYRNDRFEIHQLFIRDFAEEESMLSELGEWLRRFSVLVTYNGRTFDAPIVEGRCVLSRVDIPFAHMRHFDMLYMARRLWKASQGSCKLTSLEQGLARFLRGPDVHGSRIPAAYFEFLRSGWTGALSRVFTHNAYDILSLAALTILATDRVVSEPAPLDDPRDVYSLARVLDSSAHVARSVRYYRTALDSDSLPAQLRRRVLERLSLLYRRLGQGHASLGCCEQLMRSETFSFVGYEGAAIYYERTAQDPAAAHRVLDEAIGRMRHLEGMDTRSNQLEKRKARLLRRFGVSRFASLWSCGQVLSRDRRAPA